MSRSALSDLNPSTRRPDLRKMLMGAVSELLDPASPLPQEEVRGRVLDLVRAGPVDLENWDGLRLFTSCDGDRFRSLFGPLAALIPLTEPSRRHVIFAAVAGLSRSGRLDPGQLTPERRASLVTALLSDGAEELISWAYGSCPEGYLSCLGSLRERAESDRFYAELHQILTETDGLWRVMPDLLRKASDPMNLIGVIREVPPGPAWWAAATRFEHNYAYLYKMELYEAVTGRSELTEEHARLIADGQAMETLLVGIYQKTPFPPPVLAHPELRHVADGEGMFRVRDELDDRLGASVVADAMTGSVQYYVWRPETGPHAVFAVQGEGPFGWSLEERSIRWGGDAPEGHSERLRDLLAELGVVRTRPVGCMLSHSYEHEELRLIMEAAFQGGDDEGGDNPQ